MYKKIILVVLVLSMTVGLLTGCSKDGDSSMINTPKVKADTIGDDVVDANSNFAFDIFRNNFHSISQAMSQKNQLLLCHAIKNIIL